MAAPRFASQARGFPGCSAPAACGWVRRGFLRLASGRARLRGGRACLMSTAPAALRYPSSAQ
eukprot:CAMPEP_0180159778 /NCGR_PEP_ID=MMETSP0986-20121125/27723_1 /TAXON_ID=697907 /ORGANISM="non described non described, Strain CCMP2293" /LENGTH=61 /DNA_ID=CAMNT_0022109921 /DNA_START=133 /DNA_END=318 /DNA_ORIENTATION=+